jgi:hypothetical protein
LHAESSRNFLPRTIAGRLVLGILSLAFLPFSAVFLYAISIGPAGLNAADWLVRVALWEFFGALFAVSACGITWAAATPAWLPRLIDPFAKRLVLLAILPLLILAALAVWPI